LPELLELCHEVRHFELCRELLLERKAPANLERGVGQMAGVAHIESNNRSDSYKRSQFRRGHSAQRSDKALEILRAVDFAF